MKVCILKLILIVVYFIMRGKIKIFVDINQGEKVDSEPVNIPFIAYVEGSYFGDNDIFF